MLILSGSINWFNSLSRLTKIASFAGAILAVVVSGAAAINIVEPVLPAHRGYVRNTELPLIVRVITAQLGVNREERERLLNESKQRELELAKPEVQSTPAYQKLLQERYDHVKKRLDEIDKDDKALIEERKAR